MSDLPYIMQGVKESKKVTRTAVGKTSVTVTLTADDGTASTYATHTYSTAVAKSYEIAKREAWMNLYNLLQEKK